MSQRGSYQKVSSVDRQRLVSCFEQDEDWLTLAETLNIRRQTARSIILRFKESGNVQPLPKGGAKNIKVTDEIKHCALQYISQNSQATLAQIQRHLQQQCGMTLHIATISRMLDGELISLKLARVIPNGWNSESTKQMRQEFADWMMASMQKNFVYIDEFGINIWTRRSQGRSIRGERAIRVVHGQRGKNLTTILAISPRWGLVHWTTLSGGLHNEQFSDFMMECSSLLADEEAVFVYDNARPHIRAPYLGLEKHEQVFLPPYSPILNACEMAGSTFKANMKSLLSEPHHQRQFGAEAAAANGLTLHNQRLKFLHELAQQAVVNITIEKCQQWFQHTLSYLPKCARKEDIFD